MRALDKKMYTLPKKFEGFLGFFSEKNLHQDKLSNKNTYKNKRVADFSIKRKYSWVKQWLQMKHFTAIKLQTGVAVAKTRHHQDLTISLARFSQNGVSWQIIRITSKNAKPLISINIFQKRLILLFILFLN